MTPKENPTMNPDDFDSLTHERRTEVRGLEVEHYPNGENPWARGHEFNLLFHVGPSTTYNLTANAAELRRWSMILAEAALRLAPEGERCPECDKTVAREGSRLVEHEIDGAPCNGSGFDAEGPTCPACGGDVHIDLSGAVWSTTAAAADRARALHRPIPTYQQEAHCPDLDDDEHREAHHHENVGEAGDYYCDLLRSATVCSECLDEEGERVEYPCPTIRAMDGEKA